MNKELANQILAEINPNLKILEDLKHFGKTSHQYFTDLERPCYANECLVIYSIEHHNIPYLSGELTSLSFSKTGVYVHSDNGPDHHHHHPDFIHNLTIDLSNTLTMA